MNKLKLLFMTITDPLPWVVDRSSRSILDLGCGQGKVMAMINIFKKIDKVVGVDLYKPYIKQAQKLNLYDQCLFADVRKIKFPSDSFDIVLASHILEHLKKNEALKLLSKMEKIAKRQVIIATPIGKIYQPMFDENILQEHKSYFYPEDFEKRGYKIIKYGVRWLLDEHSEGLVHKITNPSLKKILYLINFLLTPLYYLIPSICDYSFVAYKNKK